MEIELERLAFSALGPVLRGVSYNGIAGLRAFYVGGEKVEDVRKKIPENSVLQLDAYEWPVILQMLRDFVDRTGTYPALVSGIRDKAQPEGWLLGKGSFVGIPIRKQEWPSPIDRSPIWDRNSVIQGKVALVTGAAQGFGWEIAQGLARFGAHVVIADLNQQGAEEKARNLPAGEGQEGLKGTTNGIFVPYHLGVGVDVSNEESLRTLAQIVCQQYGGIDLVVSNAGVLRAGAVTELSLSDFELVTRVNYAGFFLVTKHTAPLLGIQNKAYRAILQHTERVHPDYSYYYTDIVEINSKSGLEGSNKNAAYAGSKFGGIGLVQSFALELVEHGIKVNAICPGNFFDGPLWSDPEKGLFVQYLRAGKVPGAKTVQDVRRAYEAKIPMGRGCGGIDVVRCLLYLVEQRYETGQAVPVAGGQVMLR